MRDSYKIIAAKLNEDGKLGETKMCVRCKRMFTYLGYGHFYCPMCRKADEEDFAKVKNYIFENGTAPALEVSEVTGISLERIHQYLREGRLEIPENSPIFIKCEMCSVDIRSGRLCPDCASKLNHAMREKMNFDDEQIGSVPKNLLVGKMRFLGREN
ncbi:MAG: hypothetical protein WCD89_16665 [Anaerocolumna sp.]